MTKAKTKRKPGRPRKPKPATTAAVSPKPKREKPDPRVGSGWRRVVRIVVSRDWADNSRSKALEMARRWADAKIRDVDCSESPKAFTFTVRADADFVRKSFSVHRMNRGVSIVRGEQCKA